MDDSYAVLDSINHCTAEHAGRVVISGSHGGLYSAYKITACRVRGAVFNDAGRGKNDAGIAALTFCEQHGLPVVAVANTSARIGDAQDMLRRGVVSCCNAYAACIGIAPGMPCAEAVELLLANRKLPAWQTLEPMNEYRHEFLLPNASETVVCLDSASLIIPEDIGRVVITGSHGGLLGGNPDKAINVKARFAAFNDAGLGMDEAGVGRLAPLDRCGIAAAVVSHTSAEIGNGRSTLYDGVISRVNTASQRLGCKPGIKLADALAAYILHCGG